MDEAKRYISVHGTWLNGTSCILYSIILLQYDLHDIILYYNKQFTAHSPRHLQMSQHALSVFGKGQQVASCSSDKVGVTLKTKPQKEGKEQRECGGGKSRR